MKNLRVASLLLLIFLFPTLNYADNTKVLAWTQQTLLATLTVDYQNMKDQLAAVKKNYSPSAWAALKSFLGDKEPDIRNDEMSLHPKAFKPGVVVDSGTLSGVSYWRINQSISVPEFNSIVNFSVVVIQSQSPPFLIQSVNITPNPQ